MVYSTWGFMDPDSKFSKKHGLYMYVIAIAKTDSWLNSTMCGLESLAIRGYMMLIWLKVLNVLFTGWYPVTGLT